MVDILTRYLRLAGFQVRGVMSADEVIDSLADWGPDVIVTDVQMPGGGAQRVLDYIEEQAVATPVLLMTGGEQAWARQAVVDGRAAGMFEKPFFLRKLIDALSSLNCAKHPH